MRLQIESEIADLQEISLQMDQRLDRSIGVRLGQRIVHNVEGNLPQFAVSMCQQGLPVSYVAHRASPDPLGVSLRGMAYKCGGHSPSVPSQTVERSECGPEIQSAVTGLRAQLGLDLEQTVVFRCPLASDARSGLDLSGVDPDDEIGDDRVFRFT